MKLNLNFGILPVWANARSCVPIFGNKKGDITSLNQLGILGELFSEFAFALHLALQQNVEQD